MNERFGFHPLRRRAVAALATVFGAATILAGSRVLSGSDPGYVVFLPLLVFNTVMGFVYIVAGVLIWRDHCRGRAWAGRIALLNLSVLLAIAVLYASGGAVAVDSLMAMTVRTVAWGTGVLVLRGDH
jgi:hypothetical protein